MGGKLLSGIMSKYSIMIVCLDCIRVKGGESKRFRMDSGVRQGCIMSPWLFNVYLDALIKDGSEIPAGVEGGEITWLELVLCGESEEDLREMVGRFVEVCRRRSLKDIADKRKVMVLNGGEGLKYEVYVDGIREGHVSEFKYLGYFLGESSKDGAECSRRAASAIRSLVNAWD